MHSILFFLCLVPIVVSAQQVSDTLRLSDLVIEALRNNPELKAFEYHRDAMEVRAEAVGRLDDPELTFMHEMMPNFRWSGAMYSRIGIMQRLPFPGKLAAQSTIAEINAEHAHHEHMEKANEVLARLRSAYYELWFAQRAALLNRENARLLEQFTKITQTRFSVGQAPQQDVLKAYVEIAKLDNQLVQLRQQELMAKAMLRTLLYRPSTDTLGIASVSQEVAPLPSEDTLQVLAQRFRGMILHDSLSVEEANEMLSLMKKESLPDLTLGIEYMTIPNGNTRAWSVSAGISLPFMPWSLARNSAKVEEAEIQISRRQSALNNTRAMIRSAITALYAKAEALRKQLDNYSSVIVPQAQRSVQASMIAYQTGTTDFLMLIDSYRMLVELSMEQLMLRMQYELTVAELKREVGYAGIFDLQRERR
ncbi:MAG: hypothetical protein C4326_06070 [Ignavibacteria bacterium]